MSIESRQHKRYHSKEGILAAFSSPDETRSIKLGKIIDISHRGLAFQYLAMEKQTQTLSELRIVGSTGPFLHLEKIPCEVVYDLEIGGERESRLEARRCGVRFSDIPEDQLSRLNLFIQNYTTGAA